MKRRRVAPWIAGAVAVLLLTVVVIAASAKPAKEKIVDSPLLGRPAPAAAGEVVYGPAGTLASMKGKYVLVNFFATWCVPCRTEHPELVRWAARHAAADDASVLQVVYGDRTKNVRAFLDKHGATWPVLDDPTGAIALEWGVRGLPESYLVDPNGFVLAKVTGGATAAGLDRLLQRAKAGDTST